METVIQLQNISFCYPQAAGYALKNISFSVAKGQFVVVTGPTGAGKTTLCLCLNGLVPQLSGGELTGNITVQGLDPRLHSVQAMSGRVGLVLQDPEAQVMGASVAEDIAFGPCNLGLPPREIDRRVRQALTQAGLTHCRERQTLDLSGGEKQRLAIAGMLAMRPEILVLDEPAAELDPDGRAALYATLDTLRRDTGLTLIVVEQSPAEIVDRADNVIVLNQGRMAWQGRPAELYANLALIQGLNLRPLSVLPCDWDIDRTGSSPAFPQHFDPNTAVPAQAVNPAPTHATSPLIEFCGLSYSYPAGPEVLHDLNLTIQAGELVALIGPNGSGKTTLAKHLNALLKPSVGETIVAGINTKNAATAELAPLVGYVFQNPDHQIFAASVEQELEYGLKNAGLEAVAAERIAWALELAGLEAYRQAHPYTLGKGQRQLLAVASILALQPRILVVDEPTAGLDWDGTRKIMNLIRHLQAAGTTVILISHDLELVNAYATRVIAMDQGRIVADGPPEEVLPKLGTGAQPWAATADASCRAKNQEQDTGGGRTSNSTNMQVNGNGSGKPAMGQRLDIRTKLLWFLTVVILAFVSHKPLPGLLLAALAFGLAVSAKVPWRKLVSLIGPLVPLCLIIIVFSSISLVPKSPSPAWLDQAQVLVYLPPGQRLVLTGAGIERGFSFVLRIMTMLGVSAFLLTAPVDDFAQLMDKFRIPHVASFMLTTAIRFIPTLDRKRLHILEAQQARGARLNQKTLPGQIRANIPLMVPLLLNSIVLANNLAMATLNRGYGLSRRRTTLRSLRLAPLDYAALVAAGLLIASVVWLGH